MLITESVVRRDVERLGLSGSGLLNTGNLEVLSEFLLVESLGKFINAKNAEDATEGIQIAIGLDLIGGHIVVTNESLTWLVHIEFLGKFLSSQVEREGVATVVRVVVLADLNSVISQVVVNNKLEAFRLTVESKHLSVIVKELLLRGNLTASKFLFEVLFHLVVFLGRNWDLRFLERINGSLSGLRLLLTNILKELTSVLISIVNSN